MKSGLLEAALLAALLRRGGRILGRRASSGGGRLLLPSDISGLYTWYRSDQGITIATGVSQWNDLSGNAKHLTQATGANQPAYNATDSNFNNHPSLTFDGSNDYLSAAYVLPNPSTFFAMVRVTAGASSGCLWSRDAGGGRFVSLGSSNELRLGNAGPDLAATKAKPFNGLLIAVWNGASSNLRISGTDSTGNAGGTGIGTDTFNLGELSPVTLPVSQPFNGRYAECGWYNKALSAAEIAILERYMTKRYGAI